MPKKKKIRVPLRKNRQKAARRRRLQTEEADLDKLRGDERLSGKGELTRYRTIIAGDESAAQPLREVDLSNCRPGRVLSPRGGGCLVQAEDGSVYECAVRRVLKDIAVEERTPVAAGDRVLFLPVTGRQGVIERVEPRTGLLTRRMKGRKQVLAANVDQVLIVASAADPGLKLSLVDRYLISAAVGGIRPIICINKVDLVDVADLTAVAGVYSQLGYETVLASAATGIGIARLRRLFAGKETAFTGQSGVGKTSLINRLEPGLNLRTVEVASESRKGKHTTTTARLLQLSFGGWVVDTPGVRQMELWDVVPEDVEAYFPEFRPYLRECRFPDCSHTHEARCGVKRALARGFISTMRYESYCRIRTGD